jgi:hypothetical protein
LTVPAVPSANDPNPVELGVRLAFAKPGVVKGIRFSKNGEGFKHSIVTEGDSPSFQADDCNNSPARS